MQKSVVLAALAGLAAVAWAAHGAGAATGGEGRGAQLAAAAGLGALGGIALYHAAFGFTGGWRRFDRERRGAGVRAQLLLVAVAAIIAFPLIAFGRDLGWPVGAWVFPFGAASAIGAAMFGFGMQLGGGCGSGTLFTVGGGSSRMVLTLLAFLAGSVIWTGTNAEFQAGVASAAAAFGADGRPTAEPFSLIRVLGVWPALMVTLATLGALALLTIWMERARHGDLEPEARRTRSLLQGPWSLIFGALALAMVVIGTLLLLGRPWGITSAYPLWGAKLADAAGLPIRDWAAWSGERLERSVFADATGVMNFGIMLGALAAAGAAGRFAPTLNLSARDVATAIIGGLLMGYGARLAYGCNIGGFVGGVVSGSLHGWWWLLFGALGSWVGVRARAGLGMDPPIPPRDAPQTPPA